MVSRRTRVASWIFRRDHPSRPKVMICCFFSSFKTFAMLREATYPPAAVNVLDVSSESMAAFQVFLYGRFWVFTEDSGKWFFPALASLITSAGRLLLGMVEACVEEKQGTYLFCDTDSLAIVSSRKGGRLNIPGSENKRILPWREVREIAERFSSLNPYDPKAVKGSILNL